jgi:8-oxo-dGTP pyrophosphatase MutT (NUDIX family)
MRPVPAELSLQRSVYQHLRRTFDARISGAYRSSNFLRNHHRQQWTGSSLSRHRWDIPKRMQDHGESTMDVAKRELHEETSLVFDEALFDETSSVPVNFHIIVPAS